MEKNMKRLLAMLLVVTMCFSLLPAASFADGDTVTEEVAAESEGVILSAEPATEEKTSTESATAGAEGQTDNNEPSQVNEVTTLDVTEEPEEQPSQEENGEAKTEAEETADEVISEDTTAEGTDGSKAGAEETVDEAISEDTAEEKAEDSEDVTEAAEEEVIPENNAAEDQEEIVVLKKEAVEAKDAATGITVSITPEALPEDVSSDSVAVIVRFLTTEELHNVTEKLAITEEDDVRLYNISLVNTESNEEFQPAAAVRVVIPVNTDIENPVADIYHVTEQVEALGIVAIKDGLCAFNTASFSPYALFLLPGTTDEVPEPQADSKKVSVNLAWDTTSQADIHKIVRSGSGGLSIPFTVSISSYDDEFNAEDLKVSIPLSELFDNFGESNCKIDLGVPKAPGYDPVYDFHYDIIDNNLVFTNWKTFEQGKKVSIQGSLVISDTFNVQDMSSFALQATATATDMDPILSNKLSYTLDTGISTATLNITSASPVYSVNGENGMNIPWFDKSAIDMEHNHYYQYSVQAKVTQAQKSVATLTFSSTNENVKIVGLAGGKDKLTDNVITEELEKTSNSLSYTFYVEYPFDETSGSNPLYDVKFDLDVTAANPDEGDQRDEDDLYDTISVSKNRTVIWEDFVFNYEGAIITADKTLGANDSTGATRLANDESLTGSVSLSAEIRGYNFAQGFSALLEDSIDDVYLKGVNGTERLETGDFYYNKEAYLQIYYKCIDVNTGLTRNAKDGEVPTGNIYLQGKLTPDGDWKNIATVQLEKSGYYGRRYYMYGYDRDRYVSLRVVTDNLTPAAKEDGFAYGELKIQVSTYITLCPTDHVKSIVFGGDDIADPVVLYNSIKACFDGTYADGHTQNNYDDPYIKTAKADLGVVSTVDSLSKYAGNPVASADKLTVLQNFTLTFKESTLPGMGKDYYNKLDESNHTLVFYDLLPDYYTITGRATVNSTDNAPKTVSYTTSMVGNRQLVTFYVNTEGNNVVAPVSYYGEKNYVSTYTISYNTIVPSSLINLIPVNVHNQAVVMREAAMSGTEAVNGDFSELHQAAGIAADAKNVRHAECIVNAHVLATAQIGISKMVRGVGGSYAQEDTVFYSTADTAPYDSQYSYIIQVTNDAGVSKNLVIYDILESDTANGSDSQWLSWGDRLNRVEAPNATVYYTTSNVSYDTIDEEPDSIWSSVKPSSGVTAIKVDFGSQEFYEKQSAVAVVYMNVPNVHFFGDEDDHSMYNRSKYTVSYAPKGSQNFITNSGLSNETKITVLKPLEFSFIKYGVHGYYDGYGNLHNYSREVMPGVAFDLYYYGAKATSTMPHPVESNAGAKFMGTAVSDSDGIVHFTDLVPGFYGIVEFDEPTGYYSNKYRYWKLELKEDGSAVVTGATNNSEFFPAYGMELEDGVYTLNNYAYPEITFTKQFCNSDGTLADSGEQYQFYLLYFNDNPAPLMTTNNGKITVHNTDVPNKAAPNRNYYVGGNSWNMNNMWSNVPWTTNKVTTSTNASSECTFVLGTDADYAIMEWDGTSYGYDNTLYYSSVHYQANGYYWTLKAESGRGQRIPTVSLPEIHTTNEVQYPVDAERISDTENYVWKNYPYAVLDVVKTITDLSGEKYTIASSWGFNLTAILFYSTTTDLDALKQNEPYVGNSLWQIVPYGGQSYLNVQEFNNSDEPYHFEWKKVVQLGSGYYAVKETSIPDPITKENAHQWWIFYVDDHGNLEYVGAYRSDEGAPIDLRYNAEDNYWIMDNHVPTMSLKILKKGIDPFGNVEVLRNAGFILFKCNEDHASYAEHTSECLIQSTGLYATDENGKVQMPSVKPGEYVLKEVMYVGNYCPNEWHVSIDETEKTITVTTKDGSKCECTENGDVILYNVYGTGNVDITTMVNCDDGGAGDPNHVFTYTITLDNTSINGTYGDVTFTDGVATVQLKHREKASIVGLPAGTKYISSITELDGYDSYVGETSTSYHSTTYEGQIMLNATRHITYMHPLYNGGFYITTSVGGNAADPNREFIYTVTLSDKTINGEFGKYGQIAFENGVGTVTLKHGQSAIIANLLGGTEYTVEITEKDLGGYSSEVSNNKDDLKTGTVYSGKIELFTGWETVYYHHELYSGNLEIGTTVGGSAGDKNQEFTYTITLNDKTINGEINGVTFKDGVGTVTLKHGQKATIEGLLAGVEYTVEITEAGLHGYTSEVGTSDNSRKPGMKITGKIEAEKTSTVAYHHELDLYINLTIHKYWYEEQPEMAKDRGNFGLTLYADGKQVGKEVMLPKTATEYTWENLPKFDNGKEIEYTVKETTVPRGYFPKYTDGAITNIHVVIRLPQTGLFWWPVMLLGIAGAAFLTTGILSRKKRTSK